MEAIYFYPHIAHVMLEGELLPYTARIVLVPKLVEFLFLLTPRLRRLEATVKE